MDWGVQGMSRLAPADVTVVVDVLRFTSNVSREIARGRTIALDEAARSGSINGAYVADAATSDIILAGSLRNATAVADLIAALQRTRGERTSIAIIPCGERTGRAVDAPVRYAVEDALGAGAIIAALSDRGIDHTSPDAAAAGESFIALKRAVAHMLKASGSGRELIARGLGDDVTSAAQLDIDPTVPRLINGVFQSVS